MTRFFVAVAAAGLAGLPAAADVSAEDVWANMMAPYEALNAEVAAEPVRQGDRLIVEELGIRFSFAEGRGRLLLTTNGVTLEENGDGTVSVLYPDVSEAIARMEFLQEDGSVEALDGTLSQEGTGLTLTASGAPGDVSYDLVFDELVQDVRITFPEELGGATIDADIAMAGGTGTYRLTEGELIGLTCEFDYPEMTISQVSEGESPVVDGESLVTTTQESVQRMTGVRTTIEAALPARGLSIANLSEGLRDGLRLALTSSSESTRAETNITVNGEAIGTQSYELGAQAFDLRFDEAGLVLDGAFDGLDFAMTGKMLPVPMMFGLAGMEGRLAAPVNRTEETGEAELALTLDGLELGEGIWATLDPGGALPREPAALAFDATVALDVLVDLLDIEALVALEQSGDVPVLLQGLDLRNLLVKAAGARLTGDADVAFDNDDWVTFDGFPAPEGVVNLVLEGGNALLDRLVDARLLPEDQAGGVRMMMGLFAVKGDGEDTLTSTIEMKPGGVIEANGQRVR